MLLLCLVAASFNRPLPSARLPHSLSPSQATVSFSTLGGSAKQVLDQLKTRIGMSLEASPQTADEFLFIEVQNAPVQRLLDEIAWSVSGSWEKDGATLTLVRTDADRSAAKRRARNQYIAAFREGIAFREKKLASERNFNEENATRLASQFSDMVKAFDPHNPSGLQSTSTKLSRRTPAHRAMARIVSQFSAEEFADLPVNVATVYSNYPTAMQRPFGPAANEIFAAYVREQGLWLDAARKLNIRNPQFGNTTYGIATMPDLDDPVQPKRFVLEVSKSPGFLSAVALQLNVVNAEGQVTDRVNDSLSARDPEGPNNLLEVKPVAGEAPLVLDAEAKALYSALRKGDALPKEVAMRLLDAERQDPLAILTGPLLRAYAKARRTNFVACLADTDMLMGSMVGPDRGTPGELEQYRDLIGERKKADGWTSWRPFDHELTRQGRTNRKTFAGYLLRFTKPEPIGIEEKAFWAARIPMDDVTSGIPTLIANKVRTAILGIRDTQGWSDQGILKLYGSLTTSQKRALRGDGLSMADFNREQRDLIAYLTYRTDAYLHTEQPMDFTFPPRRLRSLLRMPSEALPNGIAPQARLRLSDTSEAVAFTTMSFGDAGYVSSQALNADLAGFVKYTQENPTTVPGQRRPIYDLNRVFFGKQVRYNFVIQYNEQVTQNFQVEDSTVDSLTPVAFDRLPAAFLSKVNEVYQRHKNRTTAVEQSTPVNNPPPPK